MVYKHIFASKHGEGATAKPPTQLVVLLAVYNINFVSFDVKLGHKWVLVSMP